MEIKFLPLKKKVEHLVTGEKFKDVDGSGPILTVIDTLPSIMGKVGLDIQTGIIRQFFEGAEVEIVKPTCTVGEISDGDGFLLNGTPLLMVFNSPTSVYSQAFHLRHLVMVDLEKHITCVPLSVKGIMEG